MITNYVMADGRQEQQLLSAMRARAQQAGETIQNSAAEIMRQVRLRGFDAVREYSLQFDGAEPRELSHEELETAVKHVEPELLSAMKRSAEHIRAYQNHLLTRSRCWESPIRGGMVGQLVRGLHRVGIYVPGGTAAYPSSVLMNAVPARVAGVKEIVMVTPPTENLNNAVLAAAAVAGVDRVIAVGGVQAVAALSYGAGFIPKVDKLVGPGNAYVAAAKRMAYGELDIDMVAGPSEVLVIADETAKARYVAADMLSQAEHDKLASAVLLTTSGTLAKQVLEELEYQSARLSRNGIIRASLRDFGAVIVCENMQRCIELANQIAPEHLEVMTQDPMCVAEQLTNAGALFLGEHSPEPLGDYMAGPDHVLPTSGTARFFSPLSVESFLKRTSVVQFSHEALNEVKEAVITLAQSEKLTAHANSIEVRFE